MKKICSVSKLNKTVRTGEVSQQLLKDIDLKIEDGEFVVIVGPSGAGKSTLLNILGGLDSSTSGDIESAGFRLSKSKEKTLNDYRRKIGFVFQDYSLIENLTVKENIEVMSVVTKKKCDADKALSLVGMKEHADKFPGQLSGGEKQRVAIARALAKEPAILFCDEPTGALDEKNGKNVLRILQDLNRKGTTVIVVTHLLGMQKMADHVIRVIDGQIKEDIRNKNIIEAEDVLWN
ncbi:MAG: ABC transporter ATP-binding protein [Ruminococcus sp.]|jgi:putative ABC transport system ATP-binding protein|nr:ABC transporter ATP-binding protein [Ruminococcus sp.]